MGVIKQGVNGSFSGKAGSVIGSTWKGIAYIKGLNRKYRDLNVSEERLQNRIKFALLTGFLGMLKVAIRLGFTNPPPKRTELNYAYQSNVDHAFEQSDDGSLTLAYSHVRLSRGTMEPPINIKVEFSGEDLICSWRPEPVSINGKADDEVLVVIYLPHTDYARTSKDAWRSDGGTSIHIREKAIQSGATVHCWFFCYEPGKRASNSFYLSATMP